MLTRRTILRSAIALPFLNSALRAAPLLPTEGDQTKRLQNALTEAPNAGGVLQLGPGTFNVSTLMIDRNVTVQGIPGATKLVTPRSGEVFLMRGASHVVLQGLGLRAKGNLGNILSADGIERLVVQDCDFSGGETGMRVASCGGRIVGNRFQFHEKVGIQSIDSKGFSISENRISDIGNCGIQVWQTKAGEDGSVITENHISRVASRDGGDGQNGNGINIYKAGNVTVANNRISDCAFTGVRNNSGPNCIITGNSISRCNEVALFVEFNHEGSVVANNLIESVAHGISIVNLDVGGRLSQCTGNIIRNVKGFDPVGVPLGGGILVEADTLVANNLVDNAALYGIRLGWGPYGRNLQASNNMVLNCRRGIEFSAVAKGPYIISNNTISAAKAGAIFGMDHDTTVTTDLMLPGAQVPDMVGMIGNMVRN
jgi:uncharacterized secreted repeat protein (TIGR03808 family)